MYGFVRIGAAVPKLKVADCLYNQKEIINIIYAAKEKNIQVLNFPELCITAYTCGDLFFQNTLLKEAENALTEILNLTKDVDMFITLGIPIAVDNQCFNCCVAIYKGNVLGIVPKTYIPNYSEFYEKRWFTSSNDLISGSVNICGQSVPIGGTLLFNAVNITGLKIGIEICEDLWNPIPPSTLHSLAGATLNLNLSASNELVTKYEYRKSLVSNQSAKCVGAYVYSSAGLGESTQDMVFSGHSMIFENGTLLKESQRFNKKNQFIYSDIDIEQLVNDRKKNINYMCYHTGSIISSYTTIDFGLSPFPDIHLERVVPRYPFVPNQDRNLDSRCHDIFNIQISGLSTRIMHIGAKKVVLGISGGLDSTLALLVCIKSFDFLGLDRKGIIGVTMPGFGTTDRTYNNAHSLMQALNITIRDIPIKESVLEHFLDIGHDPNNRDTTYENAQARERTQILMDIANMENGIVIGTGDLSELALGFATYNGDHMSMYGVNSGVPKTLVTALITWISKTNALDGTSCSILKDIVNTPVSPELLPPDKYGEIKQKTEDIVGPYELHDFFLYYVVRFGFSPKKVLYLAEHAFEGSYKRETLKKWLVMFYKRFFSHQFKRSCMPDGPKVGTISLSPRGDWRMPSDASSSIWVMEAENL